jgi:hypothetical protein
VLPGGDAPEHVVFKHLKERAWGTLFARISRDTSLVHDACTQAMTLDHHEWVKYAASQLKHSGDHLWRAMCAEWAEDLTKSAAQEVIKPILDALP